MDEREDYESEAPEAAEPVSERVRITGAEPAGETVGIDEPAWNTAPATGPAASPAQRYLGFDADADADADADEPTAPTFDTGVLGTATRPVHPGPAADASLPDPATPDLALPDLPHWTEPATGQVPAVLDRRGDDDDLSSTTGDAGPAWREHQHEWDETGFEPAQLADDETRVGALDDAAPPEHLQWQFGDLDEETGVHAAPRPDTSGPGAPAWSGDESPVPAPSPDPEPEPETIFSEPTLAVTRFEALPDPSGPVGAVPGGDPGPGPVRIGAARAAPPLAAAASDAPAVRGAAPGAVRGRPRGGTDGATPTNGRGGLSGRGTASGRGGASGGRRNVPVAVATGLGAGVVALLCFALGTVATVTLATIVVILAAAECFAALRRAGFHPATLLGLVASAALMVAAYAKGVAAFPLVLALMVAATMVWYLVGAERGSPVRGISATLLAFVWVGVLGAFAGLILSPSQYPHRHGIAFLLGAIVAVVGEDVGALAVGSWIGRHPLAPRVSPNKTWEGFFGGLVTAVVLSVVITGQVSPWTPAKAAMLGVVAAVLGPIGDLCESLVKRDLGLKDMGSMLPGHGGVLDRVDGLLFVLPATYYLVRVLHLG